MTKKLSKMKNTSNLNYLNILIQRHLTGFYIIAPITLIDKTHRSDAARPEKY